MAAKSISKTEVLNSLAEATGMSKKEIAMVLDEIAALIGSQIGKKGPGDISNIAVQGGRGSRSLCRNIYEQDLSVGLPDQGPPPIKRHCDRRDFTVQL